MHAWNNRGLPDQRGRRRCGAGRLAFCANGLYDQRDEIQLDFDLRGRYTTDKDWSLQSLLTTAYFIPNPLTV